MAVLLVRFGMLLAGLSVVLPAIARVSLPALNELDVLSNRPELQSRNGSHHGKIVRRAKGLSDFLEKGRMMNCLMRNTQEGADEAFPGKAHTNNNDFAGIAKSRWRYETYNPETAHHDYVDAYAHLGINADDFVGVSQRWRGAQVPNRKNRLTVLYGEYENAFDIKVGAILAAYNTSSQAQAQQDEIDESVYLPEMPEVYTWADMIFLQYEEMANKGGGTVHALEHVFRHNVVNPDTKNCVTEAYNAAEVEKPETWEDRLVLTPPRAGEEETESHRAFFSMLYTPNLRGVCWMLVQHKGKMGIKVIDRIEIWDTALPQIYVHIAPWNPPAS